MLGRIIKFLLFRRFYRLSPWMLLIPLVSRFFVRRYRY